jgi:hypothetical protein
MHRHKRHLTLRERDRLRGLQNRHMGRACGP